MTTDIRSTSPLQATARWTAAVRAGERERPDRLVDDPWAADLAGPEGMAWLAGRPEGSVLPIVIRTRYFDDWLRAVAIEGPLRQVVLLGAGLDTRAWRLPWPAGAVVYELDRARRPGGEGPDALRRRRRAGLRPPARGGRPGLRLGCGPVRRGLRRRRAQLPGWSEGVLFYLPDERDPQRARDRVVAGRSREPARVRHRERAPCWSRRTRRPGSTCRQPPGRHGSGRWTIPVRCSRTSAGRPRWSSRASQRRTTGAGPCPCRRRRCRSCPTAGT